MRNWKKKKRTRWIFWYLGQSLIRNSKGCHRRKLACLNLHHLIAFFPEHLGHKARASAGRFKGADYLRAPTPLKLNRRFSASVPQTSSKPARLARSARCPRPARPPGPGTAASGRAAPGGRVARSAASASWRPSWWPTK